MLSELIRILALTLTLTVRLDLSVPIVHGEILHMDARVLQTGACTMLVEVLGKKNGIHNEWRNTHSAIIQAARTLTLNPS